MDKILEKKGNNVLLKIALNWKNLCEIYNAHILTVMKINLTMKVIVLMIKRAIKF